MFEQTIKRNAALEVCLDEDGISHLHVSRFFFCWCKYDLTGVLHLLSFMMVKH